MPNFRNAITVRSIVRAAVFLGCTNCATCHPSRALERDARKFDKAVQADIEAASQKQQFYAHSADAMNLAEQAMSGNAGTVTVSRDRIVGDWEYESVLERDAQSELIKQDRSRLVVIISTPAKYQVAIASTTESGKRVIRPGNSRMQFGASERKARTMPQVQALLADIERNYLASPATKKAAGDTWSKAVKATAPENCDLVVDGNTVKGTILTVEEKQNRKGTKTAKWEHRTIVKFERSGDNTAVFVKAKSANRFTVDGSEGEWSAADVDDRRVADAWVTRLLDTRSDLFTLPATTRELPPPVNVPTTAPPPHPRPRGMDEIKKIASQRAYETQTGDFNVCLDTVITDKVGPDGSAWDAADSIIDTVGSLGSATSSVAGGLNELIDSVPLGLGRMAAEATSAGAWIGNAELAGSLATKGVDLTRKFYKGGPDLYGTYALGDTVYNLPLKDDNIIYTPASACTKKRFKRNAPAFSLSLQDDDSGMLNDGVPDPVAYCQFTLSDVLDSHGKGVACGPVARAIMSQPKFIFDPQMVDVIGLPQAEQVETDDGEPHR